MGLAASQARLLSITARKADCEFQSMTLSHEKIALARNMERLSDEYQKALQQTKLVYDYYGSGTSPMDLTYGLLMNPSSYNDYAPKLITNSQKKVVLDSKYAAAAALAGIPTEGYMGTPSSDIRNRFIEALVDSNVITPATGMAVQSVAYNNQVGLGYSMVASQSTQLITYEDLLNELSANTMSTSEYGLTLGGFYALQENNDFADWYYLTARDRSVNDEGYKELGTYDVHDKYGWELINTQNAYAGGRINSEMGAFDGVVVRDASTRNDLEVYRDSDHDDGSRFPTASEKNSCSINLVDLLTGNKLYNIALESPDAFASTHITFNRTFGTQKVGQDADQNQSTWGAKKIDMDIWYDGSPFADEMLKAQLFVQFFNTDGVAYDGCKSSWGGTFVTEFKTLADEYAKAHMNDKLPEYGNWATKGYNYAYREFVQLYHNNYWFGTGNGPYCSGSDQNRAGVHYMTRYRNKESGEMSSFWGTMFGGYDPDEWEAVQVPIGTPSNFAQTDGMWLDQRAEQFANDHFWQVVNLVQQNANNGSGKTTNSHAKDIAYLQQLIVGDESEGCFSFLNWMVDQFQTVLGGREENNLGLQYAYNAVYDLLYPNEDVQQAAASCSVDMNPSNDTIDTYQSIVTNLNTDIGSAEYESSNYIGFVNATRQAHQGVSLNLNNLAKVFLTAYVEYMNGVENSNYLYNVGSVSGNNLYKAKSSDTFTVLGTTEVDDSTDNLTATYYDMLFNQICVNGWTQNTKVNDSDYMQEMLKSGAFFISTISNDNNYYQNGYNADVYVAEVSDSDAVAQAEAKYNAEKAKIESKENIIDMKMKNLQTEVSALTSEYDTTKNLINKTIEKTLKRYEA